MHPSQGLKPKRIAEAQAAIIAWVGESAAAMHAECPEVPTRSRGLHGRESHRRGTVEGVEEALNGRHDQPDEIWLVDTTIKAEWTVWCLMQDGLSFPDEETSFRYRDFRSEDPAKVGVA